jgi:hypothetical protein
MTRCCRHHRHHFNDNYNDNYEHNNNNNNNSNYYYDDNDSDGDDYIRKSRPPNAWMFDLFPAMASPATLTLLSLKGRVRQMRESQVFQTRIFL